MTTTETNGHVEEWVPNGDGTETLMIDGKPTLMRMPMPPNVEWDDTHQRGFTVNRRGDLWVATKMGVYFDTDAVLQKIRRTVNYWDGKDRLYSIRVDLGVVPA